MKILLLSLSLLSLFACTSKNSDNEARQKEKFNFLKKQECSNVVTMPAEVGKALGEENFTQFKNQPFEIIEWYQSNWGGRHQAKTNIVEMTKLGLNKINILVVTQCALEDEDMKSIGKLTSLKKLDVSQNKMITDAGLKQLHSLTALKKLNLNGCSKISGQGIIDIKTAIPECEITHDGIKIE